MQSNSPDCARIYTQSRTGYPEIVTEYFAPAISFAFCRAKLSTQNPRRVAEGAIAEIALFIQ